MIKAIAGPIKNNIKIPKNAASLWQLFFISISPMKGPQNICIDWDIPPYSEDPSPQYQHHWKLQLVHLILGHPPSFSIWHLHFGHLWTFSELTQPPYNYFWFRSHDLFPCISNIQLTQVFLPHSIQFTYFEFPFFKT